MDSSSAIGDVPAEVGPRLKRVRPQRDVTLTELAATGSSKSTLSRLESGPRKRTHEGYGRLYALAGELRLILADHDITTKPGEVAEFDTQVAHWFGPTSDRPVEILSILGREGERIHVHAATRRKTANRP